MTNHRAQDYEHQRKEEGSFLCDRCGFPWPLSFKRRQDGFDLCLRDFDEMSPMEAREILARDQAEGAREDLGHPDAWASDLASSVAITGLSADPVNLTIGGSAQTLTLTGVNLATATITYSSASVEDAAAQTKAATSIVLSVRAPAGAVAGDYHLVVDGVTWKRGVFRVRI